MVLRAERLDSMRRDINNSCQPRKASTLQSWRQYESVAEAKTEE